MAYVSPWSNETVGPLSPGMLASRGDEVLKFFAKAGVSLPAGNRLERAIATIRASNEPGRLQTYSDRELATVAEALRTTWDAFLVTHAWKSRPRRNSPFPPSSLACFAEGADLPENDSVPKPRSTQFELFVTTQFVLGGADVRVDEQIGRAHV